ncbi:methylated-DNA--[protein]-cysteine S-methyltransferase [Pseudonocardia endophytica]|uniref:O-6-methylguanine DNA methyltransferase n=1 Tax=Pseudonocardia endophytica TaxID=401976 RepID=A0A4R1HV39_PSEEN|nr:methylated-DNA--[protein]-cysteine S-methyltransferase [Pseudonocardia endophytica]TCK25281.1 O-6-methylguanine DNA methyltransferase [Pseudonocardia endophytica]
MSIEESLAGLAEQNGPDLEARVFAGWLTAPSRLGDVHVAVTGAGVQYLRSADGTPGESFAETYRERFGRPLRQLSKAPRGLLPALKGSKGQGPDLDVGGLSEFERSVLDVTSRIPAGQVRPYGWVAREAGRPAAVRAAASVLARNPVPLLVPCHRVVRGTGVLGDYMYGAERKRELLSAEGLDVDGADAATARGELFVASDTTGIVCFPSCHHARRITGPHRRPFRKVDAARAAGYRPCRDCRPAAVA